MLIIYEGSGTTVREIFLDGRPLPKKEDVEPWWNGYSVGRWEGDTLVVETTGFMDDGWLDVRGSPLTSGGEDDRAVPPAELRLARDRGDHRRSEGVHEAVRRDGYNRIMPTAQLIEFVCIDKDAQHYVGGQQQQQDPQVFLSSVRLKEDATWDGSAGLVAAAARRCSAARPCRCTRTR